MTQTRLDNLKEKVETLYHEERKGRAPWAYWLYEHHVLVVMNYAEKLAKKYHANMELAQTAALLHDIADYKMRRKNPMHEAESLKIATKLMKDFWYTPTEIKLVVDDAIRFHSCHNGERPQTKEGLILATADALSHLKTDLYIWFVWAFGKEAPFNEHKQYILKKLDRDLYDKIAFEAERRDAKKDYEQLKSLFSR